MNQPGLRRVALEALLPVTLASIVLAPPPRAERRVWQPRRPRASCRSAARSTALRTSWPPTRRCWRTALPTPTRRHLVALSQPGELTAQTRSVRHRGSASSDLTPKLGIDACLSLRTTITLLTSLAGRPLLSLS